MVLSSMVRALTDMCSSYTNRNSDMSRKIRAITKNIMPDDWSLASSSNMDSMAIVKARAPHICMRRIIFKRFCRLDICSRTFWFSWLLCSATNSLIKPAMVKKRLVYASISRDIAGNIATGIEISNVM